MNRPARYLFASFFMLLVASLIFNQVGGPESLRIYHIIPLFIVFGGLGFAVYGYHVYGFDGRFGLLLFTYMLCMVVLIGVALQQGGLGFPAPGRAVKLGLIALLVMFFLGVCPKQLRFIKQTWVYLFAFFVLFSIHLLHAVPLSPSGGSASVPIWAGFLMGLNLFVIPRYVSRNTFLWVLSLFASVSVLLGALAYSIGPYSVLGMNVTLWDETFSPIFVSGQLYPLESVFPNPNTFGFIGFMGAAAAIMLAIGQFPSSNSDHEGQSVRADGASATVLSFPYMFSLGLSFFAGVLFVINVLGMYLSNSRASYLALAMALLLFFSYITLGRRSLPFAFVGLTSVVLLFLFLLPQLGISASGRFALWSGALEAFLQQPKLLGEGIINTKEFIAPYVEEPYSGHSPHNSYLNIFLRAGLIGGGMYLLIIVGSLFSGALRRDRVDVPALVLAFGCAIHQMFEAYSLFWYTIMAVISSLAFGYLIMNGAWIDQPEEPANDRKRNRNSRKSRNTSRSKSRSETWSRPEWNR
ncbi:O-antigen ligase family protein [Halocatena marina]|uniref:O-antigen ligase family protein n=1 Tax=Halocatena marina TaxID=2934937 RepID=A0ABD5YH77_9EURY|nr:O-antigen ligase family protein [Halocatena marina]